MNHSIVFFILTSVLCVINAATDASYFPQTKFPGNDMASLVVSNAMACLGSCLSTYQCKGWTFVSNPSNKEFKRCYLKNPLPRPLSGTSCCVSGIVSSHETRKTNTIPMPEGKILRTASGEFFLIQNQQLRPIPTDFPWKSIDLDEETAMQSSVFIQDIKEINAVVGDMLITPTISQPQFLVQLPIPQDESRPLQFDNPFDVDTFSSLSMWFWLWDAEMYSETKRGALLHTTPTHSHILCPGIFLGTSNEPRLFYSITSKVGSQLTGSISKFILQSRRWHHLSIIQSGQVVSFYLDGILDRRLIFTKNIKQTQNDILAILNSLTPSHLQLGASTTYFGILGMIDQVIVHRGMAWSDRTVVEIMKNTHPMPQELFILANEVYPLNPIQNHDTTNDRNQDAKHWVHTLQTAQTLFMLGARISSIDPIQPITTSLQTLFQQLEEEKEEPNENIGLMANHMLQILLANIDKCPLEWGYSPIIESTHDFSSTENELSTPQSRSESISTKAVSDEPKSSSDEKAEINDHSPSLDILKTMQPIQLSRYSVSHALYIISYFTHIAASLERKRQTNAVDDLDIEMKDLFGLAPEQLRYFPLMALADRTIIDVGIKSRPECDWDWLFPKQASSESESILQDEKVLQQIQRLTKELLGEYGAKNAQVHLRLQNRQNMLNQELQNHFEQAPQNQDEGTEQNFGEHNQGDGLHSTWQSAQPETDEDIGQSGRNEQTSTDEYAEEYKEEDIKLYIQEEPTINPFSCEIAASYYLAIADGAMKDIEKSDGGHGSAIEEVYLEDGNFIGHQGEEDQVTQFQIHAAAEGDPHAQMWLARQYFWGRGGVERDPARAVNLFQQAADQGNPEALYNMGVVHANGHGGVPIDHALSFDYFQRAADAGYAAAQNGIAIHYLRGGVVEKNETKAFEYFKLVADRGNSDALFNVGALYKDGIGVERNSIMAIYYMAQAAARNHARAAYILGTGYYAHKSWIDTAISDLILNRPNISFIPYVGRSCHQAVKYLEQVARIGDWSIVVRKGLDAYLEKDPVKSLQYYEIAAELGYHVARDNVKWLLRNNSEILSKIPLTVEGRLVHSTFRLAQSMKSGTISSIRQMGDVFFNGLVCPVNYTMAANLYASAGFGGDAQGSYNLGYCYEFGYGVTKNTTAAVEAYKEALNLNSNAYWAVKFTLLRVKILSWWNDERDSMYAVDEKSEQSDSIGASSLDAQKVLDWDVLVLIILCILLGSILWIQRGRRLWGHNFFRDSNTQNHINSSTQDFISTESDRLNTRIDEIQSSDTSIVRERANTPINE